MAITSNFAPGRGALTGMLRTALAARRRRQTERALARLSDAVLRDIGIRRSEIQAVFSAPMTAGERRRWTEN
jgi:uncharacterized protein YjiS (DUF1127 family)